MGVLFVHQPLEPSATTESCNIPIGGTSDGKRGGRWHGRHNLGGEDDNRARPRRVRVMKRFLSIIAVAVLGAAAGSAFRQKLDGKDITFAASPWPIAAGAVAGLLSPKMKRLVALVSAANLAVNESSLKSRLGR